MSNHPSDGSVRWVRGEQRGSTVPPNVPSISGQREFRVGVKALVTDRDRVLLIKERRGDGSSFWTLPGGGVESEESFSECLRRELEEEIRCRATVGERIGRCVYSHTTRPATTVYAVFDATLNSEPEPNPAERVLDYAWLEPTDLLSTTLDPVKRFIDRSMAGTDEDR